MSNVGPNFFGAGGSNVIIDAYTANLFGAYGTAKLLSAYAGPCLRCRRSSDNTEQDIGFDSSGSVDSVALLTFVGATGNGFVTKWYDQSGGANDILNATTASQPVIVMHGFVLMTVKGDGLDDILSSTNLFPSVNGISVFFRGLSVTNATTQKYFQLGDRPSVFAGDKLAYWSNSNNCLADGVGVTVYSKNNLTTAALLSGTSVYAALWDGAAGSVVTQMTGYINGVQNNSASVSGGVIAGPYSSKVISLFRQPTNNANSLDDGGWPACVNMSGFLVYSAKKSPTDVAAISAILGHTSLSFPVIPYTTRVLYDAADSYITFVESTGAFLDHSGNSRATTIVGAGTITHSVPSLYTGLSGGATFDSAQQTHATVAQTYGTLTALYFETTVSVTNLTQAQYLFSQGASATWGLYCKVNTDGSIDFSIVTLSGGAAQQQALSAAGVISAGVKHKIVCVWDRLGVYQAGVGKCYVFVDNVQVAGSPSNVVNFSNRNDGTPIQIGSFGDANLASLFGSFTMSSFVTNLTALPVVVRAEHSTLLGT